jgi:ABC-2 type transport system permease protein
MMHQPGIPPLARSLSPRPHGTLALLIATARLDVTEALRARWFHFYALVFCGIVGVLLGFGLTESRVMGFQGLSRTLVTYTQLAMAILPIFVLISTVRTIAGDREAGVYEYMLALPIPLGVWYAGRFIGRFAVTVLPVVLALVIAALWGVASGVGVPWRHLVLDIGLLVMLIWCFLGISFLISSILRSADAAQTVAFVVWIVLVAALDLVLLGLLIRKQIPAEAVVGIALANPLQVFRTGSMLLFDPQLVLLGPAAWTLFDLFGERGFLIWAFVYPLVLGLVAAYAGAIIFRRSDLS